jgi:hypothetical protein
VGEVEWQKKKKRGSERWQKIGQFRRQIVGSQAMSGRRRRRWNQRGEVVDVEVEVGRGWPWCCWRADE